MKKYNGNVVVYTTIKCKNYNVKGIALLPSKC